MTRTHRDHLSLVGATLLLLLLSLAGASCAPDPAKVSKAGEPHDQQQQQEDPQLLRHEQESAAGQLELAVSVQRARKLCRHNEKLHIQTIPEMLRLIGLISKDDRACKSRYLSAIYELEAILKLERDALCEPRAFDMIKEFHFRFIQPPKRANRRPEQFEAQPSDLVKGQLHPEPRKWTVEFGQHGQVLLAPLSLRHFFLKFALQVSYLCKKDLINNLQADAERVLSDEDREIMQMFERDSPIGQALAGGIAKMDFDSVLHIPELDGQLDATATATAGDDQLQTTAAAGREQHLRTSASEDSALFQLVHACKHRFKPLYEKLLLPIVRMSKLGYDYQGSRGFTERELAFLTGARMKNWLVVMHVCEIFKNTHLIRVAAPVAREKTLRQQLDELEREPDTELEPEPESSAKLEAQFKAEPEVGELEEGKPEEISERERRQLEGGQVDLMERLRPIEYELTVRNVMADRLMISDERELDLELARKHALSPLGFRGLLRRALSQLKRGLSKLDLERFAHYRRNSLFYSGFLNFLSACSNVASITMTITALAAG